MAYNDPHGHAFGRWLELTILHGVMKSSRFKIMGLEHVPETGPLVLIINHIAFSDPMLVFGSFPRRVVPLAKVEAFNSRLLSFLMKVYGTIPVHRGEVDMGAIKSALRILKDGGVVLLAPEGTRSLDHQLRPGKDGATILALRSGAPIMPIGITGTHQLVACWKRLRRPAIHLSVGAPCYVQRPASGNSRPSREEISAITHEAMYRLAAQLPPDFRGAYGDVDDVTFRYLMPARA